MKIKSYKDLQPGDVWLGMTVSNAHSARQYDLMWFKGVPSGFKDLNVQALIDAGNDVVERTPGEGTVETTVHRIGKTCVAMVGSLD